MFSFFEFPLLASTDVVTAHKNLIKEKEALELSLKIMTDSVGTTKPQPESSATKQEEPSEEEKGTDVPSIEAQVNLI